ncbi:MAG TPA: copper resistance protein CopC [Rhodanobacteraceae bacterium]
MRNWLVIGSMLAALVVAPLALAHAFPSHSSPAVGATLTTAPHDVKIWFDGELEPVFSTLIVKDASNHAISTGKGEVDPKNHTLLETALPATLAAGKYAAYWSVIAHDGHHTAGHFAFTVK